ncbi:Hypothetical predicted protein [Marmota monax]|uniref:Uncharacterized protein n=1 Tax=Marmota monax TaxID=9995 RepID=A0A5E4C7Y5_MARMO|nr:Hypothetical predicted protein [Marmota monax]
MSHCGAAHNCFPVSSGRGRRAASGRCRRRPGGAGRQRRAVTARPLCGRGRRGGCGGVAEAALGPCRLSWRLPGSGARGGGRGPAPEVGRSPASLKTGLDPPRQPISGNRGCCSTFTEEGSLGQMPKSESGPKGTNVVTGDPDAFSA